MKKKNHCSKKDTGNENTDLEEIFTNHICDKGLMLRIYKGLNNRKRNNPIQKQAKDFSRCFAKEEIRQINT